MLVIGHRGAKGEAPENTIAGFRHAIERGVQHLEFDLRLSADEQIVIIHDETLDRTCYSEGKVAELTVKELAAQEARKDGPPWPNKKDTGVATLAKVLEKTPEIKTYQFEVKPAPAEQLEVIAKQLGELFPNKKSAKKIIVTSFDAVLHHKMQQHAPHITRGLVSEMQGCLAQAQDLGCSYIVVGSRICTSSFVRRAKQKDIHVSVWTVNDLDLMTKLYEMEVDSVITDYPSMAIPFVGSLQRLDE